MILFISEQSSALPIAFSVSGQSSAVPTAPFHFWAVISFTHSPIPFLGSYQLYPQPHSVSGQSSALPTAPFHFWAVISFTYNPFPFLGTHQLYPKPLSISRQSSALPSPLLHFRAVISFTHRQSLFLSSMDSLCSHHCPCLHPIFTHRPFPFLGSNYLYSYLINVAGQSSRLIFTYLLCRSWTVIITFTHRLSPLQGNSCSSCTRLLLLASLLPQMRHEHRLHSSRFSLYSAELDDVRDHITSSLMT